MSNNNPNQFSLPRGVQGPGPVPAPMPAQPVYSPPGYGGLYNNTNEIMNPNKQQRNQALFGRWGGDPNGNNEIGRMYHDLSAAWYPIAASRVGFANQMEPGRQANLQQMIFNASPQGQQATVDDARHRLQAGAVDQGNAMARYLAQTGGGIAAQQGAAINAMNQANQQAGGLQAQLASPQGQMAMQQMLAQLYGEAQNPGIDPLAAMFGPMEARHSANYAEQGSGSFLGSALPILGQMAGGGVFGNLGHGQGGSGSGNRNPESTTVGY